ncbi:MAG: hypothetical protein IPL86_15660 [Flavobacteriales bacterium]|nr:hypothetical protein [Flavobacteriales bacterium]
MSNVSPFISLRGALQECGDKKDTHGEPQDEEKAQVFRVPEAGTAGKMLADGQGALQ